MEISADDAILLVDDEADFVKGLARLIRKEFPNNPIFARHTAADAIDTLQQIPCALMITDMRMPGTDGLSLLEKALATEPALAVVVLTGFGTVETAVSALKAGAYDFLTKPIDQDMLYRIIRKGLERASLMRENRRLREAMVSCRPSPMIIGDSPAMRKLNKEIEAVAAADYTVIIHGESGSGKELVARAIHSLSKRGANELVSLNCTAVPEHILESELFGHVRGAFTGAVRSRQGLFLSANGSTLLLDEIGDMPLHLQPKILRTLQEGEIRPVGGSENIHVDVRILASTHQRLESLIASGSFREDLYYRLNVLSIRVPALRERPQDIPLLSMHFLRETCREMKAEEREFSNGALEYLASRQWQGNVRELQNFIRRMAVFCSERMITENHVRLMDCLGQSSSHTAVEIETYKDAKNRFLNEFTRSYIRELLEKTEGNISHAARISGLERVSLQKIVKRLGIDAAAFRSVS